MKKIWLGFCRYPGNYGANDVNLTAMTTLLFCNRRSVSRALHAVLHAVLRSLTTLAGLLLLFFIATSSQAAAGAGRDTTSREMLEKLVKAQALASNPWPGRETTVDVGPLDDRLQLPACQTTLETFVPPGTRLGGHGSIGVRCPDAGGWKLFVPVTLHVRAPVVVAIDNLPAGSELTRARTRVEMRDLSALPYGYLGDDDLNTRYRVRTLISAGSVITPPQVEPAPVITRGQRLALVSQSAGIQVSMQGEALADAALGALIQVRNLQSGRVVEGRVASADQVNMP